MRVLTDFHHAGLLNSLIMLFEGRLNSRVYRPIGMEWAQEGYWNVYDHPATQLQYLGMDQGYKPTDGSLPLNTIIDRDEDNVYYCQDIDSGQFNRAITLPDFKNMTFDIVIASLPQHIEPYKKLIQTYQPGAKLIFQVGNQWDGIMADNIMASAKLSNVPEIINYVEYHQEFDLNIFNPSTAIHACTITSLMNCPENFPDYPLLLEIEKAIPYWDIKIHGGQGRDGPLHGADEVANTIRHSQFVWHVKAGGDGYGHILFNAAACGVPLIVNKSYYNGKLGEKLLIDGATCIDINGLDTNQIIQKIRHYSEMDKYRLMKKNIIQNFRATVDFDQDEKNIRQFLARLQ